jgi:hypothetical protein
MVADNSRFAMGKAALAEQTSAGPLIGQGEIGKYFTHFLKQSPAATVATRVTHTGV